MQDAADLGLPEVSRGQFVEFCHRKNRNTAYVELLGSDCLTNNLIFFEFYRLGVAGSRIARLFFCQISSRNVCTAIKA